MGSGALQHRNCKPHLSDALQDLWPPHLSRQDSTEVECAEMSAFSTLKCYSHKAARLGTSSLVCSFFNRCLLNLSEFFCHSKKIIQQLQLIILFIRWLLSALFQSYLLLARIAVHVFAKEEIARTF